jgi:hypothetical protein
LFAHQGTSGMDKTDQRTLTEICQSAQWGFDIRSDRLEISHYRNANLRIKLKEDDKIFSKQSNTIIAQLNITLHTISWFRM